MSPTERVQAAIDALGLESEIERFAASTATAEEAAAAVGCELGQIVKTLFFLADGRPTVVLVAGDRQADTAALAEVLGVARKKLRMGSPETVLETTGFAVGGVSPVGLLTPCDVIADVTLRRFGRVWAAAGEKNAIFGASTEAMVTAVNGQWAAIVRPVG
jgi:prolyl-tRNA editing enzyme YbaK/EbsC (Cys-tRNA(Pro) deacylase)